MEIPKKLINMSNAAARLNRVGYERLMKFLVMQKGIPYGVLGRSIVIEEKDFPRLEEAVKEHDNRPKITPQPKSRRKMEAARTED